MHHLEVSESSKVLLEQNTDLTTEVHDLTAKVNQLVQQIHDKTVTP